MSPLELLAQVSGTPADPWAGLITQGPLVAFFVILVGLILRGDLIPRGRLDDLNRANAELKETVEKVRDDRDGWREVARAIAGTVDTAVVTTRTIAEKH